MDIEITLIQQLADLYLLQARNRVVNAIYRFPKTAMQSGNDSILKNVWDEVCVQVQDEHFDSWDITESTIESICLDVSNELPPEVQYLLTYVAFNELWQDYSELSYAPEEVAYLIKKSVFEYAMKYSNSRIKKYVERGYDY